MLGEDGESRAQLLSMPLENGRDERGLHSRLNSRKPNQQDSRVNQTLPEYELAEVFVRG